MNKCFLLFVLLMVPAFLFAGPSLHESDDSRLFPYVRHGRVLSYSVNRLASPSDVLVAVYRAHDNKEFVLSGSLVGVERMLQAEFPDGATEQFVRNYLIELLAACLGSDRSNVVLREHALRQIAGNADKNTEYIGLLRLPDVAIKGNRWKLRFMTLDRHGGMILRVYSGQLRPFELHVAREFVLCSDATTFNHERALRLHQTASGVYDSLEN